MVLCIFRNSNFVVPRVFNNEPLVLVPLTLYVTSFRGALPSMVFNTLYNILASVSFSNDVNCFTFTLAVIYCTRGFMFDGCFMPSFIAIVIFSFTTIVAMVLVCCLLFILVTKLSDNYILFMQRCVSEVLCAFTIAVPLCFLATFLGGGLWSL